LLYKRLHGSVATGSGRSHLVCVRFPDRIRPDAGTPPRSVQTSSVSSPVGSFPYSVAVGGFNGDGKLDLAIANQHDNTVTVLLGDGTGTVSPSRGGWLGFYREGTNGPIVQVTERPGELRATKIAVCRLVQSLTASTGQSIMDPCEESVDHWKKIKLPHV
jgi:hypothetical protein